MGRLYSGEIGGGGVFVMQQGSELTKEAFLAQAARLGLTGDEARMDALFEETKRTLDRANGIHAIDTTGVAPSPINPQFDLASDGVNA
jgi:hypothetical protein